MMKRRWIGITLLGSGIGTALAGPVSEQLMGSYRDAGAGPFRAEQGEQMWVVERRVSGQARSCASCHGTDITRDGKHLRTGKRIAPLAVSANPQRLTDAAEVEKWFRRNCKWTWGRNCTDQEKGDFLVFIQSR